MRGLVTVMIPSYNYIQYLRECVESAATQEGVDLDIAVVDNASTDGSLDLAHELAKEFDTVRVVVHPDNGGIITSFNRCREEVRGEYAVLLCADDALVPGSLARSVAFMDAHRDVGLVYGRAIDFLDVADVPPEEYVGRDVPPIVFPGASWVERRCDTASNPIRTPEVVMRSSVTLAAGRLETDLPFTSDLNMWLRMAALADVAFLPSHAQALYRKHTNNFGAPFLNTGSAFPDLQARWKAFARFFESLGADPRRAAWEATARRTIGREARYEATRAFVKLDDDRRDEVVAQLFELAEEADPGGSSRLEQLGWSLRRRLGPHRSKTFPLFLPRGATVRIRRHRAEQRRLSLGG